MKNKKDTDQRSKQCKQWNKLLKITRFAKMRLKISIQFALKTAKKRFLIGGYFSSLFCYDRNRCIFVFILEVTSGGYEEITIHFEKTNTKGNRHLKK